MDPFELREDFFKKVIKDYHLLIERTHNQGQIIELRLDMVKIMKDNRINLTIFQEYYWQHYTN